MLIRRKVIDDIGEIPEIYFLFYEETEWCIKAKRAGFGITNIMNAVVYHKGSATIKKTNGLATYYMQRNAILFERRNATLFQLMVFSLYTVLKSGYYLFTRDREHNKLIIRAIMDGYTMQKRSFT